jgi:2-methylcitrate dehydratase
MVKRCERVRVPLQSRMHDGASIATLPDATVRTLVAFAGSARFAALAPETIHECRRRLIDAFGCVADGFDEPVARLTRAACEPYAGERLATLWGTCVRTTPEACAFANGVMVRCTDFSDTYVGQSRGHPSDMLGALVAVAEARGLPGRTLLSGMAVAYDVYCSFIDAVDINGLGWDQPVYGVLGTALGVARMLEFDPVRMYHAIGLALAPNMALAQSRQGELSNWKACAGPNAGRNGLFAALLAERGMTGPAAVFEGRGGLFDVIGRFSWPLPTANDPSYVSRTHIKRHPVCFHGQSAVDGALRLRRRVPSLAAIRSVRIDTYRTAVAMMGADPSRWCPATRETADHSLPFVVATALRDGGLGKHSFVPACLGDTELLALMQKVAVQLDPALDGRYPEAAPARITIGLADGQVLVEEVLHPTGHARAPLTDAELTSKYLAAFGDARDLPAAHALLAALWRIDAAHDVRREVLDHLRLFAEPNSADGTP